MDAIDLTEKAAGQPQPKLSRPLVSVVAPCYNEELVLLEFYRKASSACRVAVGDSYELLFVDDGSRDATWRKICDLSASDPHVVGVRLFRNHGHQLAVTAGLALTQGERVLLIDADLQDPPELLSEMMAAMDQGADVVYGTRSARKGETFFKLVTASLFYRLLNSLSKVPIPRDTGDFRLMQRAVVDILNAMPEQHRFIRGMVSWIGGKQIAFPYERDARYAGTTKYPLRKMIRFAVDGITSFSTTPLRIAVWLGLTSAALSFLVLGYALFQ
jgi:dolichol-phosphate mannosyltransferase